MQYLKQRHEKDFPSVSGYPLVCLAHKQKHPVDNKDQALMGFTSLRTRDMTNHDYTRAVYSRPSEPIAA